MPLEQYQVDGIAWLMQRDKALIADDPGLGKTVQLITAARLRKLHTINVVCPALVRYVWAEELRKWWPDSPDVHIVKPRGTMPSDGIVVSSYDSLLNPEHVTALQERRAALTINDECHYLKNHRALRTRAMYGRYCNGGEGSVAASSGVVWNASASPAPNDASELWPVLRFFGAYMSGYADFLKDFFHIAPCPYRRIKVVGIKHPDLLKQLIKPIMLRRRKADVLSQLPPIRISTVALPGDFHGEAAFLKELPPAIAATLKRAIEEDNWKLADVPSLSTVRRCIGLAKAASIAELVNYEFNHCGLQNIVIFAQHTRVIEQLRDRIKGSRAIHGATAEHHRQECLDEFAAGKIRCLVLQIGIAREGIRFKNCSEGLVAEPLWSPELNNQAILRFDWMAREHPVNIRFASLAGSIDEAISRVLSRKAENLAKVLA